MKKISMFVLALCSSLAMSFAQAPVPVALYSFDNNFPTTLPAGMTVNLGTGNPTYTTAASSHTVPSAK
jgi:hypothetical protein